MTFDDIERAAIEAAADLTFRDFSRINITRSESPHGFNHRITDWSLSDWFTAVLGELGEASNVAKKLNRYRDGIPGNTASEEDLRRQLADEIADTFIYLDLLAQREGIDLSEAVKSKFDRTSQKIGYPTHFRPLPKREG